MLVKCKWCGFSKDMPAELQGTKALCPICNNQFVLAPADRRTSERFAVKDIYARLGLEGKCEVKDLTLVGVGIYSYYIDFDYKIGSKIKFDLISGEDVVLKHLQAEIVRVSSEVYGCKLAPLKDSQRSLLEKAIHEGVQANQQADETLDFDISGLEEFIENGE